MSIITIIILQYYQAPALFLSINFLKSDAFRY